MPQTNPQRCAECPWQDSSSYGYYRSRSALLRAWRDNPRQPCHMHAAALTPLLGLLDATLAA